MAETRAPDLLRRACAVYDAPGCPLGPAAREAWRGGFAAGGHWMQQALALLRGRPLPGPLANLNALGALKYGLAGAAALLVAVPAVLVPAWPALLLCVPAFYAVEAQMIFLFPLALDGRRRTFRAARCWTVRAGGTLAVMRTVLPLAIVMLFGGFARQGFLRSWCLGCLAVCLWYEDLRTARASEQEYVPSSDEPVSPQEGGTAALPARSSWDRVVARAFPLEFGASGSLLVRREEVDLRLGRRVRLLYASDLHLGHAWTRAVPAQLIDVCRLVRPDAILLGGDLVDRRDALAELEITVRDLTAVAPVAAVPGNHDERTGVPLVRQAVVGAGGQWLHDRRVEWPLAVDGRLATAPFAGPRVLCAHYPHVFPAAARAGYGLVFAGHLHGGQCVLATVGGRLYPAAWLHRWHGLRFTDGIATMLVSRGVADTLPIRFNCPREVLLCEIS